MKERERDRETEREIIRTETPDKRPVHSRTLVPSGVASKEGEFVIYVVCVREKEKERERER